MLASLMGDNPLIIGGLVLVESQVSITMDLYRQDAPHKCEAGGILLGHRRGPHLHVTEATVPTACDKRARTRFLRSSAGHQEHALSRWQSSGGTMDYLGEWHTHPEDHPQPSCIDREAWAAICAPRTPLPMVFIIVGMSGSSWLSVGRGSQLAQVHAT